jgi:hypothetical protein
LAVQLLEQALDSDDYATGSELYRFLRSIYDADMNNSETNLSDHNQEKKIINANERSHMVFLA